MDVIVLAELGSLHVNVGLVAIDKKYNWACFYLPCKVIGYPAVDCSVLIQPDWDLPKYAPGTAPSSSLQRIV